MKKFLSLFVTLCLVAGIYGLIEESVEVVRQNHQQELYDLASDYRNTPLISNTRYQQYQTTCRKLQNKVIAFESQQISGSREEQEHVQNIGKVIGFMCNLRRTEYVEYIKNLESIVGEIMCKFGASEECKCFKTVATKLQSGGEWGVEKVMVQTFCSSTIPTNQITCGHQYQQLFSRPRSASYKAFEIFLKNLVKCQGNTDSNDETKYNKVLGAFMFGLTSYNIMNLD